MGIDHRCIAPADRKWLGPPAAHFLAGLGQHRPSVPMDGRPTPVFPAGSTHSCVLRDHGLNRDRGPQVLSLAASDQIAVAVRSIMFALIPMISLGFGLLFRIETVSGRRLLGLLLGFIAIGIIALFGSDNAGFGGKELSFLWFGAMLLVVALYAFENNWVKLMMPGDMNPFVALLGANLFSVFLLIPVMLAQTDTWIGLPLAFDGIHARPTFMFWLVTAIQIIAYGGFVFCIDKGGPAFAGQVSYIVTASGVLWGLIIFQQERLTPAIVIALIVVLGGIALVNPNRQGAADKTKAAIGSTADETAINR